MIRHCVFVKFKSSADDDERAAIFAQLADLKNTLSGVVAADFGPNISPEGLGKGFAHGFVMDFVDAAARDAYLVAPAHQAAGARLVAALEGGVDGLIVFDLAIA